MDTSTQQQLAVALQGLVDQYELVLEVDTGDAEADEQYRFGVESVLGDIKSLLNDFGDGMNFYHSDKPFVPIGFRLHAVIH